MYYRLKNEIDKNGYTLERFATKIGMAEKTLRNKINGVTDFAWTEVLLIRELLAPETSLEELFRKEEKVA